MKLVNVGCGAAWHPSWINLDISPSHRSVVPLDANRGLPFEDESIDVCYSSHVLEHLGRDKAHEFLTECRRVLRPGGIIRLVVPDLERIAWEYLKALEAAGGGVEGAGANYDWMMLELLDQSVRTRSGGDMARYLRDPHIANKDFVRSRIGAEAEQYWNTSGMLVMRPPRRRVTLRVLKRRLRGIQLRLAGLLVYATAGPQAYRAFWSGLFRSSGEIHLWMYDRFSLGRLLRQSGFTDVVILTAHTSRISEFSTYGLDVVNGEVRKPDSLYIEAVKS